MRVLASQPAVPSRMNMNPARPHPISFAPRGIFKPQHYGTGSGRRRQSIASRGKKRWSHPRTRSNGVTPSARSSNDCNRRRSARPYHGLQRSLCIVWTAGASAFRRPHRRRQGRAVCPTRGA
jgi:hypothetical protein